MANVLAAAIADPFTTPGSPQAPATSRPPQRTTSIMASVVSGAKMFSAFFIVIQLLGLLVSVHPAHAKASHGLRNIVYMTGQHPIVPTHMPETQDVTHVALAFMSSDVFNEDGDDPALWHLFANVEQTRHLFSPAAQILVAIGGWGNSAGFERSARTSSSRARFAQNVAAMVQFTGADGVDIDWEYPGGNGEDYKTVPNSQKAWEIEAYPLLLAEIRRALGPTKTISAAVPGKPGDMLAFTPLTVPRIMSHVDFLNVMTYDLLNRRDNVTKHHTGVVDSLEAVDAYIRAGCSPDRINFGLAFYVKYFETEHASCLERVRDTNSALGCPTLPGEDPDTGASLGRDGSFSWHDSVPGNVRKSFARAQEYGTYDEEGGGFYYWDKRQDMWWTFDTPQAITLKFPRVLEARHLGGVFAWGIGEDAPAYANFEAMVKGWRNASDKLADSTHSEL